MRKIGSLTPIWNQELFIGPHFDMLRDLDRNVVLLGSGPLPQYRDEHGYSEKPDLSQEILKKKFPFVELYPSHYQNNFGAGLYNEGLELMKDCDIVLRLDPDMLWTEKDWKRFIDFIRNTDFDSYRMDFSKCSINYYVTGRYDLGLKDAKEFDPLGVNPQFPFFNVLDYKQDNSITIDWSDWICHHFRGWNKPKSTDQFWEHSPYAQEAFAKYSENGKWLECPEEIKNKMENWLDELNQWKKEK